MITPVILVCGYNFFKKILKKKNGHMNKQNSAKVKFDAK